MQTIKDMIREWREKDFCVRDEQGFAYSMYEDEMEKFWVEKIKQVLQEVRLNKLENKNKRGINDIVYGYNSAVERQEQKIKEILGDE